MKLYSQEELDEHCAEFRPIPFKLQAAMFGNYNETGMNPRPPSSFHNMTTADTSEALKKRYFDLRRNPERIEPEKRRGHFIAQRINAIDMMNRRRWFEARGRVPDNYDILVESGEELNAMFRAELADLPMVPLPRIPDAEGAGGDVDIGGIAREVVSEGIRGGVPAVGSVLGSRVGAAVGGMAGPLGSAVGGQVGGLAGSVVGRNLEAFLRDRMARRGPAPLPTEAPAPPPPGLPTEATAPPPLPPNIDGTIPVVGGVTTGPPPLPPNIDGTMPVVGGVTTGPPPLPPNIDGTMPVVGDVPTVADAVEYEESLRDRLIRGMRNMAYTISRKNAAVAEIPDVARRGQEQETMGGEDVSSRAMRAERIAGEAREEFEREYDNVRDELDAFTMAAEEDIEQAQARMIISQEEAILEREAELRSQRPEAEGVRRAASLRRADRGLMRGMLAEREELRQSMEEGLERRPVSARFGVRGARPRSQSSVSERSGEALQRYQTTEAMAEAGQMGGEDIDIGLF